MTTFASLGVPEVLAAALAKRGITVPTEIQTALIPAAYAGENLIGEAPTGTGKTLAYLLPLLTRIDPSLRSVQALILAPTHELAMQIADVARETAQAAELSIRVQALIGGANIKRQIEALKKKPAVIVGSAARMLELHRLGKLAQLLGSEPAVAPSDFFQAGNLQVLDVLNGAHKGGGIVQAFVCACIQPCEAAPQQLHVQAAVVQIHFV